MSVVGTGVDLGRVHHQTLWVVHSESISLGLGLGHVPFQWLFCKTGMEIKMATLYGDCEKYSQLISGKY